MGVSNASLFIECPELAPGVLPDLSNTYPYWGFRFLEGTVLIEDGIAALTERENVCLMLGILGQTKSEMIQSMSLSDSTVTKELGNVRGKLGVKERTAFLGSAAAHNYLSVDDYGSKDLFPVSDTELEILACLASDTSNKEAAKVLHLTPETIDYHLNKLGHRVGFKGKELLVVGAFMTGHLTAADYSLSSFGTG
jgi:DNA-binding CsgD family transcriptional regulator